MGKWLNKIKQHLRRIIQISFALLTNGYGKGYVNGSIYKGNLKTICVPGLNCYSCPGALGSCPIGSLQATLANRHYKFAFYISGILIIIGVFFGRLVCGFLCPFGLIQDLLYKIPFVKKVKKLPGDRVLKWLKYLIFILFVILLPLFAVDIIGQGKPWFCEYICPAGTLEAGIPLVIARQELRAVIGFLYTWKIAILLFVVIGSIVVYRPFCRYLCPLGAFYSLFNPIALYRYHIEEETCTKCGICQRICPMDIPVYQKPNSLDCIRCGDCKKSCPQKAIVVHHKEGSGCIK